MSSTPSRDWSNPKDKAAAVLAVLRHILSPPAGSPTSAEIGRKCIETDLYGRMLFEDIGKVQVPSHARVVFVHTSQLGLKDQGTLVVEMPPASVQVTASPSDLMNYTHCGFEPATSSNPQRKWSDPHDKEAAIADVLRYLLTQPLEVRERCLKDDGFSAELFTNPRIGNINVPSESKTIFVPSGEREREIRGSLVLVVPPPSAATATDEELLNYVICCYKLW